MKLKVKQVRSTIRSSKKQKAVMEALGLHRIGQIREHQDAKNIRGMVEIVKHLVEVEQVSE